MTRRIGTGPGLIPRGADLFVPPEGAAWVVSTEDEETYYSDPEDGALYYSEGE
ncbi:hypothetical protein LRS10_09395 [Phenylobacterium sp. J426]|uniref:hypothetical protein n=1 Tax=Phenylobacterium sp. J426 TaxID=2898439 RepID=UPI002151A6B5|nr:hypothetical protein [Phenylobacterium sp. J426]MCR5874357.1 hypothetical protein [Phenylobacterium sp. J426]